MCKTAGALLPVPCNSGSCASSRRLQFGDSKSWSNVAVPEGFVAEAIVWVAARITEAEVRARQTNVAKG